MEELGIGRPSTYASTITTILNRRYVIRENKNLYVTELGAAVNKMMSDAFPAIVDTEFTANIESLLDSIEEGKLEWKVVIRNFYPDLAESVEKAKESLESVKIADEVSDVPCDQCGRMMVVKYGPHGSSLRARDSRSVGTQRHTTRRSVLHARNAARILFCARRKRADFTMAVLDIQIVISCPGRSRRIRNVRNVAVTW